MLADAPEDTFLRYALAMEYDSEENHERSLEIHQGLMNDDPPYVPSFFMCGQQLSKLDRTEEAKTVLQSGIVQAQEQGDGHAAKEMQEFLMGLD